MGKIPMPGGAVALAAGVIGGYRRDTMELPTPYVPGFAIEVDCLALLWTGVTILWARSAISGRGLHGVRGVGAWWMAGWLAVVLPAVAPWFFASGPSWEAPLCSCLRACGTGMLVVAMLVCLPRRPPRAVLVLAGAAGVGLGLCARVFGPAWLPGALDATALLVRFSLLLRGKGSSPASRLALTAILVVAAASLVDLVLTRAHWPGLLAAPGWWQWRHLAALAGLAGGGIGWWVAEEKWRRGRFSWSTIVIVASCGIGALAAIGYGDWKLRWRLAGELRRRLEWVAADLDVTDVLALYRGTAVNGGPEHRRVWEELLRLRQADGSAQYVYLMGLRDGRWKFPAAASRDWEAAKIYFDVDYGPADEADAWVLPGDRFAFLPPARDESGLVVSALVPVWDGGRDARVLLGLDYSATEWARELMLLRLPSLALLVAGGGCGLLWLSARKRRAQADAAEVAVAAVSHELRTPLQSVLGYADLLSHSQLDAEQRRQVERLRSEGRQLAHLIRQMLDLSALKAGSFSLREQSESPTRLAAEAIETIATEAHMKGLSVLREFDENLPPAIMIDGVRFRQVLVNLLTNAVRYTIAGAITLRLRVVGSGYMMAEVDDTGIGMSRAEVDRLFEPFRRGARARTLSREGAGLGLTITRQLVRRMGGEISVRSEPGRGSVFSLQLPLAPAEESLAHDAPATCRLEGRSVLVIEDHPAVAALLVRYVAALGGSPALAGSLAEARNWILRSGVPDILIADNGLPDGAGFELGGDSAVADDGEVWRVALSASDSAEIRRRASVSGWDIFLAKPCAFEEFSGAIAQCPWLPRTTVHSTRTIPVVGSEGMWPVAVELETAWLEEMRETLEMWDANALGRGGDAIADRAHYLKNGADFLGPEYRDVSRVLYDMECAVRDGSDLKGALERLRASFDEARHAKSRQPRGPISPDQ